MPSRIEDVAPRLSLRLHPDLILRRKCVPVERFDRVLICDRGGLLEPGGRGCSLTAVSFVESGRAGS
jgi:hypothetical protein